MNVNTSEILKYKNNAELAIGPVIQAFKSLGTAQDLTPDDADGTVNTILAATNAVEVGANVNDANDWLVLPSLASVPVGHAITIVSNAAGHEVRTPATSNEKINNQDSDGTKEYAVPSESQVHRFTKISNAIGWMGQGYTAIGASTTAVVPD